MNTKITHPTTMVAVCKKMTAILLSILFVLSVLFPAVPTAVYAEETASFTFHFQNKKGEALIGVEVELSRIVNQEPSPIDPEPNPTDPEPNPTDPEPDPTDPEPNPNDSEPNPNDPEPNPNDPEPSPDESEPELFSISSDKNGDAKFEALPVGKYDYSIKVPDGYQTINSGTVEIIADEEQNVQIFTLNAVAPKVSLSLSDSAKYYGSSAVLSAEAKGLGDISYKWYKDSQLLDATNRELRFEHLQLEDTGNYRCEVTSDLSDTEPVSADVNLEVEKAGPVVSLTFNPESGTGFTAKGIEITASVKHPDAQYTDAAIPQGTIALTVFTGDEEQELSTFSENLQDGSASTTFYLPHGEYRICGVYTPLDSELHYTDAESSADYSVTQQTPAKETDYSINAPGSNGWYNADNPLCVAPVDGGNYDKIRADEEREAFSERLFFSDTAGANAKFYLVNSTSGEQSRRVDVWYKQDKEKPSELDSIRNRPIPGTHQISVVLTAEDSLSGVSTFTWYDVENKEHSVPATIMGASEEGITRSEGKYYCICYVSKDEYKKMWYFVAEDNAGNKSEKKFFNSKIATIRFSTATKVTADDGSEIADETERTAAKFFHLEEHKPFSFSVEAEGVEYPEELTIRVNGEMIENPTWIKNEETNSMTFQSQDYSEDGVYVVSVEAAGYVLGCREFGEEGEEVLSLDSYSTTHIIDTTKPVLSVAPDVPHEVDSFFSEDRKAYLSVEERFFSNNSIVIPEFSATDITGAPIDEQEKIESTLLETLTGDGWSTEGIVHTSPELIFSTDAKYEFAISCADFGGNVGSYESTSFVVDQTIPHDLSIVYDTSAVSSFLSVITLGFYKPEVIVTITAEDDTSGVDYFTVSYEPENGSSSLNDQAESVTILSEYDAKGETNSDVPSLNDVFYDDVREEMILNGDIQYVSDGRIASASFKLTADQYRQFRGSLSFTATDRAGNTAYKNSIGAINTGNGLFETPIETDDSAVVVVVDTIAPVRAVKLPKPQRIRNKNGEIISGDLEKLANTEGEGYTLYYTDSQSKSITAEIQITESNFDPTDPDLVVKVNDTTSSVKWSRGSGLHDWLGRVDLTADGEYRITVDYTDHSGNEMESYVSNTIVLDRVDPAIKLFAFSPTTVDNVKQTSEFFDRFTYGHYFDEDCSVSVSVVDNGVSSGLDYVSYRLISYQDGSKLNEKQQTARIENGEAKLDIPKGFKGQIFAECFDRAGNKSAEVSPYGLVVDGIGPEIIIETLQNTDYRDAKNQRLFVSNTTLKVTITDTVSGIKQIHYQQKSEKENGNALSSTIDNTGIQLGTTLPNGWRVDAIDQNLVTKVSKEFTYTTDDNDIILTVEAIDRCGNGASGKSETFTVDKTAPAINVVFGGNSHNGNYYNQSRTAEIIVTERNFNAGNIKTIIENAIGAVPDVRFTEVSNTEHRAVLSFPQGDYTFNINGTDLGGHNAVVTLTGGNERSFVVDTTKPIVETNFAEFIDKAQQNYFSDAKTAIITITEHNFSPELVNLRVFTKQAGTAKDGSELTEITEKALKNSSWVQGADKDIYSIQFTLTEDAVYQIEISPSDLAGNQTLKLNTEVFEIDRTIPVIAARNGKPVSIDNTGFIDVFNHERRNDPVPDITFSDTNFHHLEYQLYVWIPDYSDKNNYPIMKSVATFLPQDMDKNGVIEDMTVSLSEFSADGIYTLTVTAVDTAGNRSAENVNTFVRIVDSQILAFVENSNLSERTGLFLFQNEDGTPISMRSDRFVDLGIAVFSKTGSNVDVVLRDGNGEETVVGNLIGTVLEDSDSIYGIDANRYLIEKSRFMELYPDDTDAKLVLSVKNDSGKLDLGMIHIDNTVPQCDLPEGLKSWKWYFGNDDRSFTITNITETLDIENCAIYDNGNAIENISYSAENGSITFTLSKGWHNIGIKLTDLAGNTNNIQEMRNIQIGLFWLWIILAIIVSAAGTALGFGIRAKRKKALLEE